MASDPKIRVDIEANAKGAPEVEQLARSLEGLDKSIDPAIAKKANDIAVELRKIGEQQAAIATFRTLKEQSEQTARGLTAAQAAAQSLAREIAASGAPTRAQAGQLEKLKDAVRDAKTAHEQSVSALQSHRTAMAGVGLASDNLAAHQRSLAAQQRELGNAGQGIVNSYAAQGNAAQASAAKQVASAGQISKGVQSISTELQQMQSKLSALAGAALGGGVVSGLGREVLQTADAFKSLEARIQLVTGTGPELQQAFEGVFDVARRTGASVEATGTLFTRLAQQGKDAGLTVSQATEQALSLTDTINKAMAVSGGSAASAEAALTQLIQGLQSGVLRGEEFNSLMEQSPRLARALADGLGVTTGELRKMAQAGKLSAEVVIDALKGQAQTIDREFEQLPITVGRSIQSLSTAWTQFIGETDKANGASAAVAKTIGFVAENLDALATAAFAAGKAWLAYKALDLATSFYSKARAITAATAALAADTAATTANTAAKVANTQAQAGLAAGAPSVVSRLGSITAGAGALVGGLGGAVLAFLALKDALTPVGEWLGEGAAKLMGYQDRVREVETALKDQDEALKKSSKALEAQRAATQRAEEASFGYTARAKEITGVFDEQVKKGESVAGAMQKVAQSLQVGDVKGIRAAGAALDWLAQKTSANSEQIKDALASALQNTDLAEFERNARGAFDRTEQGARRLSMALQAVDSEALRRAGTSAREMATGFSDSSAKAISNVDKLAVALKRTGADADTTGRLLGESLDKALAAANTETAVKAVIERLQILGDQGRISGEQVAAGMQSAQAKIDALQPGINSLGEAMKAMGVQSRAELQRTADAMEESWQRIKNSGEVTIQQKMAAFEKYAAAATAANGGVETSEIKVQREMLKTEAAARGLGKAITESMQQAGGAVDALGAKISGIGIQQLSEVFGKDEARGQITGTYAMDSISQLKIKQQAGTLSASDLSLAERAYEASLANQQTASASRSAFNSAGYLSDVASQLADSKRLLEAVRALKDAPPLPANAPYPQPQTPGGPPAVSGGGTFTIVFEFSTGGRYTANTASAADADVIKQVMERLALEASISMTTKH